MSEPIDGLYFNWLRAKVIEYDAPVHVYLDLLKILYSTPFIWMLIGDKNRAEDAIDLRYEFLHETGVENEAQWFESPPSVFEVLLAFAKRASFVTDNPVAEWFWKFITNLRLDGYMSISSEMDKETIDRVLQTWMFRMYDYSGYGGLFPMLEPDEDQTKIEIWGQFNRYLDDQGL